MKADYFHNLLNGERESDEEALHHSTPHIGCKRNQSDHQTHFKHMR
jgi:hypothetical protein